MKVMDTNYLKEAFQKLSLLENDFDLSVDKDKVDELRSFIADDIEAIPEEPIIDTNADDEHELQDNYIGKVILECECCHSRLYKEESEVIIDEESGLANIEEECPVCNNALGYSVIGKIEPFDKDREIEPEEEQEEVEEIPEEEIVDEVEVEESLSLSDRLSRKHLQEKKEDVCPHCGKSPCECNESCDKELDEDLNKADLNNDVYNALADVAFDYEVNKDVAVYRDDFEEAETNFNDKFFAGSREDWEDFDESLTEDIAKDAGARIRYEYEVTEPAHYGNYGLADKDGNVTTHYGFSGGCAYIAALLRNNVNNIADDLPQIKGIMNHSVDNDRATFYIDSKDKNELKTIGNEIASRFAQEGVKLKVTSTDIGGSGKYSYINVRALSLPDEAFTNGLFQDYKVEFKKENGRYDVRDESLTEGIENLSLDTEDTHMEMTSDETGKVTVTTEPIKEEVIDEFEDESIVDEPLNAEAGPEEIVPLDQEEIEDIEANEPEAEEELPEEEIEFESEEEVLPEETPEEEEEIDEFDEETFDEMGESFMRKVYSNVDKFSTTDVKFDNSGLIVEGTIKFNSGKEKATQFVFENRELTKRGKTLLEGYNNTFSKGTKTFKLKGTLTEGKFISESLFYNFKVTQLNESTNSDEVIRVCGKVKLNH